jgi:hypothetical protein
MLSLTLVTALGWPSMYPQCFPPSLTARFMGQAGEEGHSILTPGPANMWTARCSHGVLMRGGTFPGAERHGGCDGVRRYRAEFGTRTVTLLPGYSTVEIVCAHLETRAWTYASSTGRNELAGDAPAVDVDVLVVGTGLGGHAAAASVVHYGEGAASHVMVSPGSSTTARSTGVVWFPLNHTFAELQEASGFDQVASAHIHAYLADGPDSYTFWKPKLDLQQYTAPDYTEYSTGPKHNNTFQAGACSLTNASCGAVTLLNLSQTHALSSEIGTVSGIQQSRRGFRVQLASGAFKNVRAVVFANGGSGRFNGFTVDRILAGSENTGVHMTAASQLGLSINPNRNLSWGLEFEFNGSAWSERWFSFGCAPAGVENYAKCGDYNTRTLSWPDHTPRHSTVADVTNCTSASFTHWKAFFDAYVSHLNITAATLDFLSCSGETDHRLATGMIDGKDGFLTLPATMESVNLGGVYAAGTAGAYGLGNTYFGPGATLGWALHSGRLAGKAAAARVASQKKQEAADAKRRVNPKGKKPTLIRRFRWGVWLLLVAVAAHVAFSATRWSWAGFAHYVLAPIAVIVILWAAWSAHGQRKRNRIMKLIDSDKSRMHAAAGRITAIMLIVQVALGVTALILNRYGTRKAWFSWIHRLTGWYLLFVAGGLYWTSLEADPLHDDGVSKKEHEGQAAAFSYLTIGLFVFALAMLLAGFCPARRSKPQPVTDFRYVLLN